MLNVRQYISILHGICGNIVAAVNFVKSCPPLIPNTHINCSHFISAIFLIKHQYNSQQYLVLYRCEYIIITPYLTHDVIRRCVRISMFPLNTKQRRTFFKKHLFLYVAGVHKYCVSLPVVCIVIPFFFIRRFFPPRLISTSLFNMHFVFWSKIIHGYSSCSTYI
jgi:hypothetical protein